MKIVNYKKKKNNLYEITLSNNEVLALYDDVILKYELLLAKEIKEDKLKEIKNYNNYIESYQKAIKFINVKLRTEKEIKNKLKDYDKDAIEYTINRLKKEGYLNNELYIKCYINDTINLKIEGPNKILFDLKKLGFEEYEILNYLNEIDENVFAEKLNKYISKKINSNHNLSGKLLKQKIINDLINKGFYIEQINEVINNYIFIDNKLLKEKEYNKIKNKLSKKYSGEELEYRIKINMLKKGFKDL